MDDKAIIALYFQRDEAAIVESGRVYGAYCQKLAQNILQSPEDAEECVNDTWLRAWNAIPPQRPAALRQFFAKITRNLAFDRYKAVTAEKRGGGELPLVLEELTECIPDGESAESELLAKELRETVSRFVAALPVRERRMFVRRYYFVEPVQKIAARYGVRPGTVSVTLNRVRKKLRAYLMEEGFVS